MLETLPPAEGSPYSGYKWRQLKQIGPLAFARRFGLEAVAGRPAILTTTTKPKRYIEILRFGEHVFWVDRINYLVSLTDQQFVIKITRDGRLETTVEPAKVPFRRRHEAEDLAFYLRIRQLDVAVVPMTDFVTTGQ